MLLDLVQDLAAQTALAGTSAGADALLALGATTISLDYELLNEAALIYARQYSFPLVSMLIETGKLTLQNEFSDWITSGQPLQSLIDNLAPMFGQVRAEMIAATEVTRIYAESNQIAWRSSGVVESKRWQTAVDELVCPICRPLHRDTAPLNGSFSSEYGAIESPPAHPRCRCWIQPVIKI